jgi:hypothetical protein
MLQVAVKDQVCRCSKIAHTECASTSSAGHLTKTQDLTVPGAEAGEDNRATAGRFTMTVRATGRRGGSPRFLARLATIHCVDDVQPRLELSPQEPSTTCRSKSPTRSTSSSAAPESERRTGLIRHRQTEGALVERAHVKHAPERDARSASSSPARHGRGVPAAPSTRHSA